MSFWMDVLGGICVSWPPAFIIAWLGRRKLDRQTEHLTSVTDQQTDWLRPGWQEKNQRP